MKQNIRANPNWRLCQDICPRGAEGPALEYVLLPVDPIAQAIRLPSIFGFRQLDGPEYDLVLQHPRDLSF